MKKLKAQIGEKDKKIRELNLMVEKLEQQKKE